MREKRTRVWIAYLLALTAVLSLGAAVLPGEDETPFAQPSGGLQLRQARAPAPETAGIRPTAVQMMRAPLLGNILLMGLSRWDVGPGLFSDWFFPLIVYILRALYGMDGVKRRKLLTAQA